MTSIRTTLVLSLPIIIALIFAGCSSDSSSSSGDLGTQAGCAHVMATPKMVGSQVVMDVRAAGCRGADGSPLLRDDAVERLAGVVWHSLRLPVDAVHIRVPQSSEPQNDMATIMSSDVLEARFGPGPSGVVWPLVERGTDDSIWFLLPAAYVVAALGIACLARAMVRAGVVVLFFRC
jgi:hypothetical protein